MEKKPCVPMLSMRGTRVNYYNIQNTTPLNNHYNSQSCYYYY